MKSLKKILCFMLISALMINTTVANAEEVSSETENLQDLDTVYVNGVEFDFDYDVETGNVIVQGETDGSSAEMLLETDGTAEISINNVGQEDEEYNLEIHDLDKNNIDVDVYDGGDLVESYDDYNDIIEDVYEEQEAITWTLVITAALIITAVCATAYITYESDVMYIMASQFYKSVTAAKEAVKKAAKNWYYPAYVNTSKNIVYICPSKISLTSAAKLLKANGNVYSFTSAMAKKAINYSGYAPYSSNGSTGEVHKIKGKLVFYHWHKGKTSSSGVLKKSGSAHSLYGAPISY